MFNVEPFNDDDNVLIKVMWPDEIYILSILGSCFCFIKLHSGCNAIDWVIKSCIIDF